jgi:hypothetical protein
MKRIAFFLCMLGLSNIAWAASPWSGTWLLRGGAKEFPLVMVVEDVGPGWRVTYRIPVPNSKGGSTTTVMTMETALDGKDAPNLVDGKPSGQTMDIRKIDSRHTTAVVKMNGKVTGTSKSEISADGKVITSVNDNAVAGPGGAAGKTTQIWDKQ